MSKGKFKERKFTALDAEYSIKLTKKFKVSDLWVPMKLIDEARKDITSELGSFEFKQPYNYNMPQLQVRYEEASMKLVILVNKINKWFGEVKDE